MCSSDLFYVVWPLVIIVLLALLRLGRRSPSTRRTHVFLGVGLTAIAIPSFLWSLHLTAQSPSVSFFVTTTRLWEMAIGAAAALSLVLWTRLNRSTSTLLGILGLAAMVASALFLDHTTAWPGVATLLPTLGTVAVIVAGAAGHSTPASRLLSWRPMVWIGGLSYSLYLWHWPFLVVATELSGGELSTVRGLAVVALSLDRKSVV